MQVFQQSQCHVSSFSALNLGICTVNKHYMWLPFGEIRIKIRRRLEWQTACVYDWMDVFQEFFDPL